MTWRPLEGIRVCDFGWLIAGPLTTRALSDLGAEVIKIESNVRIDGIRREGDWPPSFTAGSPNSVFNDCNAGKRSITLNLGQPRGIELVRQLVAHSDIVTNNFTGERMDRWGLGYDDLIDVNPDIIMLTMSVMGRTGPDRTYGTNGIGVLAFSGHGPQMGFPERPPIGMGPLYSDFAVPYLGVLALMSALRHRDVTGEGQFIDLAQVQATIGLLGTGVLEFTANGRAPEPPGNRASDRCPHGAYPCFGEDRWIAIAVRSQEEWGGLCELIGRPDLGTDSVLATVEGRKAREDQLDAIISDWTREQEAWQAMHLLQAAGVPAAVVENNQDSLERDPHLSSYHFQHVTDAAGEADYLTHGYPARFAGEQPLLERTHELGEDNAYVFGTVLGLTDHEIAELLVEEVIY